MELQSGRVPPEGGLEVPQSDSVLICLKSQPRW